MANTNAPFGVKPLFMAEARKTAMLLPVTNDYGTALYHQDPVVGVTAGRIERGGTTGAWLGVILGLYKQETPKSLRAERLFPVQYMGASPGTTYEYFALVTMDPTLFYIMQEDGVTSSLTEANNWGVCDASFGTANNTTGISACMIDSNTIGSTATRPIQLIWPAVNEYDAVAGQWMTVSAAGAALNYAKWVVRIFNHQLGSGSLAVGLA